MVLTSSSAIFRSVGRTPQLPWTEKRGGSRRRCPIDLAVAEPSRAQRSCLSERTSGKMPRRERNAYGCDAGSPGSAFAKRVEQWGTAISVDRVDYPDFSPSSFLLRWVFYTNAHLSIIFFDRAPERRGWCVPKP